MEPFSLPDEANLWRTDELLDRGLSHRRIARLVSAGTLIRLRRGCFVRAAYWSGLDPDGAARCRIEAYAHATLTRSGGGSIFSHTSAARLHGLFLWQADGNIHLTVPYLPSSQAHAADVAAHTRPLAPAEVVTVGGLRATSLERTAADSCLILGYRQGLILMDHALRLGAAPEKLARYCDRYAGSAGVVTLRRVLAHADPLSESPGETLTRDLIRRLRLPPPALQFEVRTRLGTCRLDCAWPEAKVALEFDGRRKYFDYAPTAETVFNERRREKALQEMGWTVIRMEWRDLFREREFMARLQAVLTGR